MNTTKAGKAIAAGLLLSMLLGPGSPSRAAQSNEALARAAQNPVASLINVPFQDNINFNSGPRRTPRTC